MIREKVINNPYILEVGTVKYLRVPMRCPKFKFPTGIIVLYEYDLNVHVIQGLSLSTASLVMTCIHNITIFSAFNNELVTVKNINEKLLVCIYVYPGGV